MGCGQDHNHPASPPAAAFAALLRFPSLPPVTATRQFQLDGSQTRHCVRPRSRGSAMRLTGRPSGARRGGAITQRPWDNNVATPSRQKQCLINSVNSSSLSRASHCIALSLFWTYQGNIKTLIRQGARPLQTQEPFPPVFVSVFAVVPFPVAASTPLVMPARFRFSIINCPSWCHGCTIFQNKESGEDRRLCPTRW